MKMLQNGLYEQIINNELEQELSQSDKLYQTGPIDNAEAAKILSKYIAQVAEQRLIQVQENGGNLKDQIAFANRMIQTVTQTDNELNENPESVAERAEQLLALIDPKNTIQAVNNKIQLVRPETSIAQTSLFTGAVHEPQMY